jgi:hypothetical protein
VHRTEELVGASVEREAHPILLFEHVRDLEQLVATAAVRHHCDLELEVFEEAHEVGEARVDRGLAAADQDHRAHSALHHRVDRGAQGLLVVTMLRIQDVPVDAVVAAIVARRREIEVDRDRRDGRGRGVRDPGSPRAGQFLAPADIRLEVPGEGGLAELAREIVDGLGHIVSS